MTQQSQYPTFSHLSKSQIRDFIDRADQTVDELAGLYVERRVSFEFTDADPEVVEMATGTSMVPLYARVIPAEGTE